MRDLIIQALKAAIEQYPEIIPYLKGNAAKIVADGVEWHQKFPPYEGDDRPNYSEDDFDITEEDIERALARWDEAMPDYAGMLDAEVRVDEDAE
jgi:hypothetical protein